MRPKQRKIDWLKIKLEYMASDKALNAVLDIHKVAKGHNVQKHTKGWIDERKKLHNRILEKAKTKLVNLEVKRWENQQKLWSAVEGQAGKILKEYTDRNKTFKPRDLDNLSSAIQKALQSQRLIANQSTENIDQRNIHLDIVSLIEKAENDGKNTGQNVADAEPICNQG